MTAPPDPDLLLAADPGAPGARQLFDDFVRTDPREREARVLLAGDGLAWAQEPALQNLVQQVDVAVCSRDANDAGWRLESAPPFVRWSSVGTWLVELPADVALWVALP